MNKDLIYAQIRIYVFNLYTTNIKIKIGDLLTWVNNHCSHLMTQPYGNLRSVIGAALRRGTDQEREALEWCLLNKNGQQLL